MTLINTNIITVKKTHIIELSVGAFGCCSELVHMPADESMTDFLTVVVSFLADTAEAAAACAAAAVVASPAAAVAAVAAAVAAGELGRHI